MRGFDWKEARSRKRQGDDDDTQTRKPATFFERFLAGVLLSVLAVALLNTGVPILGFIAGAVAIYQFAIAAIAQRVKDDDEN